MWIPEEGTWATHSAEPTEDQNSIVPALRVQGGHTKCGIMNRLLCEQLGDYLTQIRIQPRLPRQRGVGAEPEDSCHYPQKEAD